MIVRKIKPTELKRFSEMCSICFEYEYDNTKTEQEIFDEIVTHPKTREDLRWEDHWIALLDDDTTITSGIASIPFTMNFDENSVKSRGIGGVVTLPPYRRLGGIRACFTEIFNQAYNDGTVLSYLYPFSSAYYKKFGYGICCDLEYYKILIDKIPKFSIDGMCYLVEQKQNLRRDIEKIYSIIQKKYNTMLDTESIDFDWIEKSNPPKQMEFTYVYKDSNGIAKSYITFKKEIENGERNITCTRCMFYDVEGFKGLLSLIKSLGSDHTYVTFYAPSQPDITTLFPELRFECITKTKTFNGMIRAINVKKVLQCAKYHGSDTITINIFDNQIPQNNGCFSVTFKESKATNIEYSQEFRENADIDIPIDSFSSLIVGMYTTNQIEWMENTTIRTSIEKLEKIFYKKPINIQHYF